MQEEVVSSLLHQTLDEKTVGLLSDRKSLCFSSTHTVLSPIYSLSDSGVYRSTRGDDRRPQYMVV